MGILSLFLTFSLSPKGCPLSCLLLWVEITCCTVWPSQSDTIQLLSGVVAYSPCVPLFFGWWPLDSMVWVSLVLPTQLSVVRHKISSNLDGKRHDITFHLCKEVLIHMVLWLLVVVKVSGFFLTPLWNERQKLRFVWVNKGTEYFLREHPNLRVWLRSGPFKDTVVQL